MLAIEVEYLMGTVFASAHNSRTEVEWPPHPSRLFAALVAAYEECDMGNEERCALERLEALDPPPAIYAEPPVINGHHEFLRDVHRIFVPINDSASPIKENKKQNTIKRFSSISSEIPIGRDRKERWVPAFTPFKSRVWFVWRNVEVFDKHIDSLQRIAEQVSYLGHSMSPVRMRVDANPPTPLLLPEKGGPVKLRVPGKGRLQHLEHVHRLRKENATIKPNLGKISSYSLAENPEKRRQRSWFAHNFVFRITGEKDLFLDEINILTSTLRKAVMDLYPDPVPEIISGHDKNGNSSMWPHLAIIPLPDVGHRYAEGRIMGFGFWLPENTPAELLDTFELTLSKLNLLTLGRSGVFNLKHVNADTLSGSPVGVRPWTYSGTSDTWASVSPVIFGKYPKKSHIGPGKNGGKIFEEICRMIGLPAPMEVRIGPVSVFRGAPKVSHYDFPERYKNNLKSHVVIKFDEPVKGPVFIGAGRFKGFGFCRPFQKGRN